MSISDYLALKRKTWLEIVDDFCRRRQLDQFMVDYLTTGGKWHRPTLAEIGYRLAAGKDSAAAAPAFASLELIHRYLLVHDDIIDQDLVRHGLPTLEQHFKDCFATRYPGQKDITYSKGMAMIAGDVICALAYELLNQAKVSPTVLTQATRAISTLLIETAEGWKIQTEQNFMAIEEVSEQDFTRGMELVSAQYSFVWPLRLGQLLAGKTMDQLDLHLDAYAYHTGIAFQIRDDYLGMFGTEAEIGKPVGHDYREGKKTLFILRTYARAGQSDKDFLQHTLGKQPSINDIERAKELIKNTGALDEVMDMAKQQVELAQEQLRKNIPNDSESFKLLTELAKLMVTRLH